jgi:succinyl-diaminopimelate desuccinylase
MSIDPVELTAALIRCPSVTPAEGGAIALLERTLAPLGFACTRISRGGIENLYARRGRAAPVFAFAGHTDVVPVGDRAAWRPLSRRRPSSWGGTRRARSRF